jgi:endonuclease/exonuclease/phosphatase family metal-dependent hydrolase
MRLAFWNCTLGLSSPEQKKQVFKDWCLWAQPDMLFVIEGGSTEEFWAPEGPLEALSGRRVVNFVSPHDRRDRPTAKRIALLTNLDGANARVLRDYRSSVEQKRGTLKVTIGGLYIYCVHADSYPRGGAAVVDGDLEFCHNGHPHIFAGDFNRNIEYAQQSAHEKAQQNPKNAWQVAHPKAWDQTDLRFTQWDRNGLQDRDPPVGHPGNTVHLHSIPDTFPLDPHNVIDFVLHANVAVNALPNCRDENHWRDILDNFDHCPTLYDVP